MNIFLYKCIYIYIYKCIYIGKKNSKLTNKALYYIFDS